MTDIDVFVNQVYFVTKLLAKSDKLEVNYVIQRGCL